MENVPLLIYALSPLVGLLITIVIGKFVVNWWFDLDLKRRNDERIITLLNEINNKIGASTVVNAPESEPKVVGSNVEQKDLIELAKKYKRNR